MHGSALLSGLPCLAELHDFSMHKRKGGNIRTIQGFSELGIGEIGRGLLRSKIFYFLYLINEINAYKYGEYFSI